MSINVNNVAGFSGWEQTHSQYVSAGGDHAVNFREKRRGGQEDL